VETRWLAQSAEHYRAFHDEFFSTFVKIYPQGHARYWTPLAKGTQVFRWIAPPEGHVRFDAPGRAEALAYLGATKRVCSQDLLPFHSTNADGIAKALSTPGPVRQLADAAVDGLRSAAVGRSGSSESLVARPCAAGFRGIRDPCESAASTTSLPRGSSVRSQCSLHRFSGASGASFVGRPIGHRREMDGGCWRLVDGDALANGGLASRHPRSRIPPAATTAGDGASAPASDRDSARRFGRPALARGHVRHDRSLRSRRDAERDRPRLVSGAPKCEVSARGTLDAFEVISLGQGEPRALSMSVADD
jgi:hypothetical protein